MQPIRRSTRNIALVGDHRYCRDRLDVVCAGSGVRRWDRGATWNADDGRTRSKRRNLSRTGRKLMPKSLPNGARVAVCITYDIDNESPLINRGHLLPTELSETDYGATTGLPRILDLLERDHIPATFYTPAISAILAPEMISQIRKTGMHEIAMHGWIHESLPALNNGPEEERLLRQAVGLLDRFRQKAGGEPRGVVGAESVFDRYSQTCWRGLRQQHDGPG